MISPSFGSARLNPNYCNAWAAVPFWGAADTLTAIATYKRTGVKLTPHACRQQHARLAVGEVRMPAGATLPPRKENPARIAPSGAVRGAANYAL